jgi:signal transduction histidine kinase
MVNEAEQSGESRADDARQPGAPKPPHTASTPDARLREAVEIAARIRHEINNPLTGLMGQAQLLLRDDNLDAGTRRRVEIIEQLAKRIRDTVAELRVVQHDAAPAGDAPDAEGRSGDPPRH